MSAKKTPKKSDKKPPTPSKGIGRWLFYTTLKLSLVFILALSLYVIYLDAKVKAKFEGERWQIPVQVFSRAENIAIGDKLFLPRLADMLKRSGYDKVKKVWKPGQFALSSSRIIIFRQAFANIDVDLPSETLTIDVNAGKVLRLYVDDVPVKQLAIEPQLITRIVPESKEDRVLVNLVSVPESLIDTLLLVEDREFYFHKGISPLGILRALYSNLTAGRTVQGGSTLTQQLVKNMFLTRDKTITRKVNEALMALILEFRYSKDQLLEAYINEVYLGQHYANGVYGFGLAAEFYFGQPLKQLTPAQMALLVGVIKGPSFYDPWRQPARAKKRRDLVLRLMFENHLINSATFESSVNADLEIRSERRLAKQYFYNYIQLVKRELPQLLAGQERSAGIKVFTGFSMKTQLMLEQVTRQTLSTLEAKHHQTNLQAAAIITDRITGEIIALVGDREPTNKGFNRALDAKRPIGSLIKPAIYLPALEQYHQFSLATVIEDKPITLGAGQGKQWQPQNYDGKFRDQVPLIDGLVNSLNIPTVNLGMMLGLDTINQSMQMLGYQQPVTLRPSMLLGAINMSPFEINQMYLPIANQGYYEQTHAIRHIAALNGETLWQYQPKVEQRLSSQSAYLVNYALEQVAERGTAKSLTWRLKDSVIAGKTGTTNDQRDSWFVGYDQHHLMTTWIGHDDNTPTKLTGSSGALVLFANVIKQLGVQSLYREMPSNIADVAFESTTGNPVKETCQQMVKYPAITTEMSYSNCMEKVEDKRSWFEKLFGG
ncbi:penicillin-binding protein 1B [Colwellia sp. MEBiC06753]